MITWHNYHSTIANDDRDVFVYTPPGYDARRARAYPVLYLLHGLGVLWIVCGTSDGLIGVNRQFKDWLRARVWCSPSRKCPTWATSGPCGDRT